MFQFYCLLLLLKYFIAIGLVKNNSKIETMIKTKICNQTGPPNEATKAEINAPPENHIVVNPIVSSSIINNTTKKTIQKLTIFIPPNKILLCEVTVIIHYFLLIINFHFNKKVGDTFYASPTLSVLFYFIF